VENGIDPDKVIEIAHGVRTIEVVRILVPQLDAEAEVLKLEAREAADLDGVEVMDGASELVQALPSGLWCVVTSGTRMLAESRLRVGKIPQPKVLVTANDVANGKPHPEPYLTGARLLGVDPNECVVVEDAPAGIRSAHAAGMKAIGITSTYEAAELQEAEAVIRSLRQLEVHRNGSQLEIRVNKT
jgi:sugar-phosphatase